MTMATAQNPKHQLKARWSLSVFAARILGFSSPGVQRNVEHSREHADPASNTDHITELLEKIDQGYLVEETGERAYLPRFARAWVKSSVSSGGWV